MAQALASENNELRTQKVSKLLRQYSVPAIAGTLASALYNVIDRVYIGNGVSPMALSGLTLTFPISNMIAAIGTLIGVGAAARMSIVLGMKDIKWARNILGHVPILTLILSAIFIIPTMVFMEPVLRLFGGSAETIPYAREYLSIVVPFSVFTNLTYSSSNIMRASGFPTKAMLTILIGVLLNIALDPIFIFVFKMGIRGAAVATAISMFVGAAFAMAHFMNKKHEISFRRECFKLKRYIIKNILSIGFSPFSMNLIASVIAIIVNTQLRNHGGDLAIASYGIINSYLMVIGMIVLGLCQGMQPIIGYNYGANITKRVKDTFFLAVRVATYVYLAGFAMAELIPHVMAAAFTKDEQLLQITVTGLRIAFASSAFVGAQIVISQYFMSVGKAGISIILTISRQLLFLTPLLLFLPHIWGLNGVWWAIPISDVIAFALAVIFINRERKKVYGRDKKLGLRALFAKK